jgi:hypothetical protein
VSTEPVPAGLIFVEAEDSLLMYASAEAAGDCPHLAELEDGAASVAYGRRGEVYRASRNEGRLAFAATAEPTTGCAQGDPASLFRSVRRPGGRRRAGRRAGRARLDDRMRLSTPLRA